MWAKQTRLLCEELGDLCSLPWKPHRAWGGGEPGARLPFTDVRPPQPQTWGRLWVAWRPLEANEGWLDRRPFHLVSPWAGVGGKTLAQNSGRAPWALLAREGRGALSVRTCQKYQAEIRAAAPTHQAKNSSALGGREAREGDSPRTAWPTAPAPGVALSGTGPSLGQDNRGQGQGEGTRMLPQKRHSQVGGPAPSQVLLGSGSAGFVSSKTNGDDDDGRNNSYGC